MRRIPYPALLILAPVLSFSRLASAEVRPAVVELFTSEGCSSCPPAEAYTAELAQRPDVLALTYHVTYWDDLGWQDHFGLSQATQRQRAYSAQLRLSSVFTPQTVIDGRRSFVGSDRFAIGRDLMAAREGTPVALTLRAGELTVGLRAAHARSSDHAPSSDVVLVAYRRSAVTHVGRGENSGRTINEVNIVRSMRTLGRWDGQAGEYRVKVDSLPTDATDVAVLLQSPAEGSIIGAARLTLDADPRVAGASGAP